MEDLRLRHYWVPANDDLERTLKDLGMEGLDATVRKNEGY